MAGWFQAPPREFEIVPPGWFPDVEPPITTSPHVEVGWWAVVGLDTALTVFWVSEFDLQYLAAWGLEVLSLNVSRSLALQKLGMLAVSRNIAVSSVLGLQGVYMQSMALAIDIQRALTLVRVAPVSVDASLAFASSLDLSKVQAVDMPAAIAASSLLGITPVRIIDLATSAAFGSSLSLGVTLPLAVDATINLSSAVAFGFPPTAEVTDTVTAGGNYTHTLRRWGNFLDIVLLGGGGGGQASASFFAYGAPGTPGLYSVVTLVRGTDFPWSLLTFTGTVGTGGSGGIGPSVLPGAGGNATTATFAGGGTLSAAGGNGGLGFASNPATNGRGPGPGNQVFNGKTYTGGGTSTSNGGPGVAPGGAGSGSGQFSSGGSGAVGRAWYRTYQ